MCRIIIALYFILIPTLVAFSQDKPMFTKHVLDNPITSSQWFDSALELIDVDIFEEQNSTKKKCLENGYAQYQFSNETDLSISHWGATPVSIDVVYTKYPFKREDWQTNYFSLLANRLKELFQLDSTLNSNNIRWRLIMQTSCKTGNEAENLFHGIVISYTPQVLSVLPVITPRIFLKPLQVGVKPINTYISYVGVPIINNTELKAILYPESVFNRVKKQPTPKRENRKDEPDCSTFKTRADKPRTSLWFRLFGK